jgi:hypothetical protein
MKNRKKTVQTSLQGIAQKAAEQRKYRFRNLAVMLDEDEILNEPKARAKDIAKRAGIELPKRFNTVT